MFYLFLGLKKDCTTYITFYSLFVAVLWSFKGISRSKRIVKSTVVSTVPTKLKTYTTLSVIGFCRAHHMEQAARQVQVA